MKKIKFSALIVLLVFAFTASVFADNGQKYSVEEAEFDVLIPDGYSVITRSTDMNDPVFEKYGLSYSGTMSSFSENKIYVDAFDETGDNEIAVSVLDDAGKDYSEFNGEELYHAVLENEKSIEAQNKEIILSDIYEIDKLDYIKLITSDKNGIYELSYTTVFGGKKYTIRFFSYSGEINIDYQENAEKTVDTMHYLSNKTNEDDKKSDSAAESSGEVSVDKPFAANDKNDNAVGKYAIIILCLLISGSIPVLLFRFILLRGTLKRTAAIIFSFMYTLIFAALFYYTADRMEISRLICIISVLWGFVSYAIVKEKEK